MITFKNTICSCEKSISHLKLKRNSTHPILTLKGVHRIQDKYKNAVVLHTKRWNQITPVSNNSYNKKRNLSVDKNIIQSSNKRITQKENESKQSPSNPNVSSASRAEIHVSLQASQQYT